MEALAPRSTSSHCGSLNALDQRVPVLPSTAAEAGNDAFSTDEAVAVFPCEIRVAASALCAEPASNAAARARTAATVATRRSGTGRKRAAERMTSPGERGDRRSTSLDLRLKFDRNLMAGQRPVKGESKGRLR